MPPIYHKHVRVVEVRYERLGWFACFEEPDGAWMWMQQPAEPNVGDEQVLYIVKEGSAENARLGELLKSGASREEVEEYVHATARKYGVWCEKTWDEAKPSCCLYHNSGGDAAEPCGPPLATDPWAR